MREFISHEGPMAPATSRVPQSQAAFSEEDIRRISLVLAKLLDSSLGLCTQEFSVESLALCMSVYVEYAAAWIRKFSGPGGGPVLEPADLRFEALCRYSSEGLLGTETKIMSEPVAFIVGFGLPPDRERFFITEVSDLGCSRAETPATAATRSALLISGLKDRLFAVVLNMMASRRGCIVFLDSISRVEAIKLALRSRRRVVLLQQGLASEQALDLAVRRQVAEAILSSDALTVGQSTTAMVALAIASRGLVENCRASLAVASGRGVPRPKVAFFGLAPFCNVIDLIWIAIHRASGMLSYAMQHGGYYGEGIPTPLHRCEMLLSDRYLTFGWSYRAEDLPIESIRLSRSRGTKRVRRRTGLALLVLENITALQDFDRDSRRSEEISAKLTTIGSALRALMESGRLREVMVRAHPFNRCAYQVSEAKRHLPFADFQSAAEGPLAEHSQRAEVCVFDSIGATGALECLNQDSPVVVFEPEFRERICDGARDFYDELVKAKVVATEAESLIDGIESGLEFSRGAQEGAYGAALLAYKKRHAKSSPDWIGSYARLLREI